MDVKRVALLGGLVVIGGFMFFQIKKMGTPAPQPVIQNVEPQTVIQEVEMAHILVPVQLLPRGTRLKPEMLEWRKWPADAVDPSFIDQDASPTAIEDWTNSVVYIEIAAGEPITARKLVKPGDKSVMSAFLEPGYRAVSIRITTDAAASGFINPGDNVDIMITRRLTGESGSGFVTETIFENVTVLSIDQTYAKGPDGAPFVLGGQALLMLSREDAEMVTMSQQMGDLSLVLRPLNGANRRGVRSAALVDANKENEVRSLQVYRGGDVEVVTLKGQ
ncbi:Flp pilus assembly protein CpaB [Robiginitomaculum antarcticum]|uniref:Flp pilus assembly protein CpaB n=1 Tax=Robiginitomaculum antarcticum TaxID=437507 RepID=UPI00036EAFF8|nr:Flp pilus assembly protein CpaB [Robiginitomaculum antarcticum]